MKFNKSGEVNLFRHNGWRYET